MALLPVLVLDYVPDLRKGTYSIEDLSIDRARELVSEPLSYAGEVQNMASADVLGELLGTDRLGGSFRNRTTTVPTGWTAILFLVHHKNPTALSAEEIRVVGWTLKELNRLS